MLCCFLCFLIGFYFHWIMGKSVCRGVVEGHPGTPGHGGLAHRQTDCNTWLQTASSENSSDAYCITDSPCYGFGRRPCRRVRRSDQTWEAAAAAAEEAAAEAAAAAAEAAEAEASQEPDIGEMAAQSAVMFHDDSNEGRRRAADLPLVDPVAAGATGVGPGS